MLRSLGFGLALVSLACSATGGGAGDDSGSVGPAASGGSATGGVNAGGGGASAASRAAAGGTGNAGDAGKGGSAGKSGTGGITDNAGNAGNSGSSDGGTGGGAPHVVMPCGSAQVGKWEDITPPGVLADANYSARKGYGVNAFVIDPLNTANVTLGTDHIGVYHTTDCGANWVHVDSGKNGAALDGGTNWSMAIDPVEPNTIYTVSGYGKMGLFKSTNAGVDWEQTLAPEYAHIFVYDGFTAQVRIDPTDHLHVVITPHFTCQAGHSETCFLQTEDGGATWSVVENAPSGAEGVRIMLVDHDTWFLGSGGLLRTSDAGKSWQRLTRADTYAYEVFHRPGKKYYLPVAFGLAQSEDGTSWSTLDNSPGANVVTTSDKRIYAGTGNWCQFGHTEAFNPITSAAIDDPTHWTVDTNFSNHYGSCDLQYDADHHMLYTSNGLGGFWRVKIE